MKRSLILLLSLAACAPAPVTTPTAIAGESQAGWSEERSCYRSEYREEYVPGTEDDPGYVKTWKETVEVSCENNKVTKRTVIENNYSIDDNDCSEGTVAGGLLGGGLAGFMSRGKDRWWAIPTGILGGAMIGCEIDGG
jgi:uncharacterized protein YcfJ